MRIKQIEVYRLQIPLCLPIRHNLADHRTTDNLVVRVTTDQGVTGFGEGVPRDFVTGETLHQSLNLLEARLVPCLGEFQADGPGALLVRLAAVFSEADRALAPAACCALELALLDAAGKTWDCTVADFFGGPSQKLVYSAILPMLASDHFERLLHLVRQMKMGFAKIKVGGDRDMKLLSLARRTLGGGVDLRVDANGAWSEAEAEAHILAMAPYDISAVEQPVDKHDIEGMRRVATRVPVPVVADESLCTLSDGERFADMGRHLIFNLRLSKCGGILAVDRLYRLARRHGIGCQLGCQVGETGILAAAGRQYALTRELVYLEGSYARHMLCEDIVNEIVEFGPGGRAEPLPGAGLGITVNIDSLNRLAISRLSFRL